MAWLPGEQKYTTKWKINELILLNSKGRKIFLEPIDFLVGLV